MNSENQRLILEETPAIGIVRLVLNSPASFNALSQNMLNELKNAFNKEHGLAGDKNLDGHFPGNTETLTDGR